MIRNFSSFDFSPAANQAATLAVAGLEAIRPEVLLDRAVVYSANTHRLKFNGQAYDLDDYDRIFFLCIGFGTAAAAKYFQLLLTGLPVRTIVMDPEVPVADETQGIFVVTHHPTASNAAATDELLSYAPFSSADLVIAVTDSSADHIVNAGSTMTPDKQTKILSGLAELGATEHEMLTVAVHLAQGRGGDLARLLAPARILNYVITNRLDEDGVPVATSPFTKHNSSLYEAKDLIEKYDVLIYCKLDSCVFIASEIANPHVGVSAILLASPQTWMNPMKGAAEEFGLWTETFEAPNFGFHAEPEWQQARAACSIAMFPRYNPAEPPQPAADGATELYLSSGVYQRPAGQIASGGIVQQIVPEFPTFNVGAAAVRLT